MNVLFVEPDFPRACKSKNHDDFMPIGLLKLASYHRKKGNAICLARGDLPKDELYFDHSNGVISKNMIPDKILITSYFTYWSEYVKKSVSHYKKLFPESKVIVGGIYASLMPEHCKKYTGCDEVFIGVHKEAEQCPPAYSYLEKYYGPVDYQIIHTSRGCIRHCEFCGAYVIEPEFSYKRTIKDEIIKEKIVFYDNNLLANPHIENILTELAYLKNKGKIKWCEAQSGLDGRIIEKNPDLAFLLRQAGFRNIRISWDGPLEDSPHIKRQLNILKRLDYRIDEDIFVFMIYNWDIPFEQMELKRIKCWEWKVQIIDCRYRPLNQTFDNYNPQKFRTGQTNRDYYIHKKPGWTDKKIRAFRKHIRQQNMCIRFKFPFYTNAIERNYLCRTYTKKLIYIARNYTKEEIKPILSSIKIPYWFPEVHNGKFNKLHLAQSTIYEEFEKELNLNAIKGNQETCNFQKWRNHHVSHTLRNISI